MSYITQRSAAKAVVLGAHMSLNNDLNTELVTQISNLDVPVFIGGYDDNIDTNAVQNSGAVLLGSNIPVALRIFESYVKPHPTIT